MPGVSSGVDDATLIQVAELIVTLETEACRLNALPCSNKQERKDNENLSTAKTIASARLAEYLRQMAPTVPEGIKAYARAALALAERDAETREVMSSETAETLALTLAEVIAGGDELGDLIRKWEARP
jgi:hypothetical protein